MIDAVFFDLDNTLLESDGDQFLEDFLAALGRRLGADPDRFAEAAMIAGAAVMGDHPDRTNHDLLVGILASELGLGTGQVDSAVRCFGRAELEPLGRPWAFIPAARGVVQAVIAMNKKVVLATSPIYLEGPIRERMRRSRWTKPLRRCRPSPNGLRRSSACGSIEGAIRLVAGRRQGFAPACSGRWSRR